MSWVHNMGVELADAGAPWLQMERDERRARYAAMERKSRIPSRGSVGQRVSTPIGVGTIVDIEELPRPVYWVLLEPKQGNIGCRGDFFAEDLSIL